MNINQISATETGNQAKRDIVHLQVSSPLSARLALYYSYGSDHNETGITMQVLCVVGPPAYLDYSENKCSGQLATDNELCCGVEQLADLDD